MDRMHLVPLNVSHIVKEIKNSLLDEIFQGPRGLCERGTLALLCSRWVKVLKARTPAHGTSAARERSRWIPA